MAQQLKEEVRQRMLEAAEQVFAEDGYRGATMAEIARRAGVATGNLYRYFENKDQLFSEVISDEFVAEFLRVLRRRVSALVEADDLQALEPEAQARAQELLRFWIEHRWKVVTLLDRSEGSRHEGFVEQFIDELMKPSLAKFRAQREGKRLPPVAKATLENVFDNTVRFIVAILERNDEEPAIREAFAAFWSYQLGGLAGFERWLRT